MVCSPDISVSYNVISSKHDSERIAEAGNLFKGNNETINQGEGGLKMSNL